MSRRDTGSDRRTLLGGLIWLILIAPSSSLAGFNPIQGFVPRFSGAQPAVDLVREGQVLRPEEAIALARAGVDLSQFDPDQRNDLWRAISPAPALDPHADELPMVPERALDYIGAASSQPGSFRFVAQQIDDTGVPRSYAFYASKTIHQMLLRKNLLRKLGYSVPKTAWVPSIRLKFNNSLERDAFKLELSQRTYGDPARWVVESQSTDDSLVLQDLVAVEDRDQFYNLSNGYLDPSLIRGRRVLNALLIPYALVSATEQSINLFPWNAGTILGDNLHLPYVHAEKFTPSFEDARWIARRIFQLTREDWKEVVQQAHLPEPVSRLLLEKLISRRNTLGPLLKMDQEVGWTELPFDPHVTFGSDLKKGELTRTDFEGYATRFAAGDPSSPIDLRQVGILFKSSLVTSGVKTALSMLSSIPVFSTDIDQKIAQHREELYTRRIESALKEGASERIPIGAYVFPTWNVGLLFGRDLAIGSYMGADNLLQLADSFGYQVQLGTYLSMDGLPSAIQAHANAGVSAVRSFTHLRPVRTIEAAMKYPYKNAVVSNLIRRAGDHLLEGIDHDFSRLDPDQQRTILIQNLEAMTSEIEVGTSLIISDSLQFGANAGVVWRPYQLVAVSADLGVSRVLLKRIHILRRTDKEFQIYVSQGDLKELSFSIRLELQARLGSDSRYFKSLEDLGLRPLKQAVYPVLSVQTRRQRGNARTEYYRLEIDAERSSVAQIRERVLALAATLQERDTELLRALVRPYEADFSFKQTATDTDLMFLSWSRIPSRMHVQIRTPQGSERRLFRDYLGKTFGVDVDRTAGETLGSVLRALLRVPIEFNGSSQSGNPGFTFLGRAKNRIWLYEEERGADDLLRERYVRLSEVWNGWAMRAPKARRILNSINRRLGRTVFPETSLLQSSKVLLYQIKLDTHVYEPAIRFVTQLSDNRIRDVFRTHARTLDEDASSDRIEMREYDPQAGEDTLDAAQYFISLRNRGVAELDSAQRDRSARSLMNALAFAASELKVEGFSQLLGGEGNFLITARLDGFRVGDEGGDTPVIGNTLGSPAVRNSAGPLAAVEQRIGMSQGELLLGWLLRRAL